MFGEEWFPTEERVQMFRIIENQEKKIKQLRKALKTIEYLDRPQNRGQPHRVSIHEIALAALKEGE